LDSVVGAAEGVVGDADEGAVVGRELEPDVDDARAGGCGLGDVDNPVFGSDVGAAIGSVVG
jgi:hypothetical protein